MLINQATVVVQYSSTRNELASLAHSFYIHPHACNINSRINTSVDPTSSKIELEYNYCTPAQSWMIKLVAIYSKVVLYYYYAKLFYANF